jgi:hypothetical protein
MWLWLQLCEDMHLGAQEVIQWKDYHVSRAVAVKWGFLPLAQPRKKDGMIQVLVLASATCC